jgi:phytoene dehydrogenase-like protein
LIKQRVIVIGAGVGGLTAAALLARAGFAVTVLEGHIYPSGNEYAGRASRRR